MHGLHIWSIPHVQAVSVLRVCVCVCSSSKHTYFNEFNPNWKMCMWWILHHRFVIMISKSSSVIMNPKWCVQQWSMAHELPQHYLSASYFLWPYMSQQFNNLRPGIYTQAHAYGTCYAERTNIHSHTDTHTHLHTRPWPISHERQFFV